MKANRTPSVSEDVIVLETENALRVLENHALEKIQGLGQEEAKVEYFRKVLEGSKSYRVLLYIDLEDTERKFLLQKSGQMFSQENLLDALRNILGKYLDSRTKSLVEMDSSALEEMRGNFC